MSGEQQLLQPCITWYDCREEHHKDLLREAGWERLARHTGQPARLPAYFQQVLRWLGHRFMVWGWCLEERYGARA